MENHLLSILRSYALYGKGKAKSFARLFGVCYKHDKKPMCEVAEEIADEIEYSFLPRPLFEDGEPVQFGDRFYEGKSGDAQTVDVIQLFESGHFIINNCFFGPNERVRRAVTAHAADGKYIKPGELMRTDGGDEFSVLRLEYAGGTADDVVLVVSDGIFPRAYLPEELVHATTVEDSTN